MTTTDAKPAQGGGFFSIYKPGQGTYVRWGTVVGAGLVILAGAAWIGEVLRIYDNIMIQAAGVGIWIAVWGVVTFWCVNTPKLAEFMIMTESEMRKVTWPTRREVFVSTKVVILLTLLLCLVLFLVDIGFQGLFEWLKIY